LQEFDGKSLDSDRFSLISTSLAGINKFQSKSGEFAIFQQTRFRLVKPNSGHILAEIWSAKIQPYWSDSSKFGKNPTTTVAGFCFFAICEFFVRAKHRKIFLGKSIFLKNNFVKNILWRKTFYVKTNGA